MINPPLVPAQEPFAEFQGEGRLASASGRQDDGGASGTV